jgi:dipeptidyl aminopeptidase/acylaminoacyl peptidase
LVVASQSAAQYAAGYLLFGQLDTLMAQRFDIGSLKTTAEPFPVAEQVGQGFPGMKFSISETGVLVYSGPEYINAQLAWYGRDGKRLGSLGEPGQNRQFVLSPDQKRVAFDRVGPRGTPGDIWVLEIASGILSPLTRTPADERAPVWSPDGKRIIFSSSRKGPYNLYSKLIGETEEQPILESEENTYAKHFYGGGRFLLYLNQNGRTYYSLPLTGGSRPTTLFKTDDNKDLARVSPDDRWIAYGSQKSGRWEIYTASFPSFAGQRQLSNAGGMQPRWRKDGRELYYVAPDGKMMVAEVKGGATLETSAPKELFPTPLRPSPVIDQYAVLDDGRRFLIAEPLIEPPKPITVILNWTAALKQQQH